MNGQTAYERRDVIAYDNLSIQNFTFFSLLRIQMNRDQQAASECIVRHNAWACMPIVWPFCVNVNWFCSFLHFIQHSSILNTMANTNTFVCARASKLNDINNKQKIYIFQRRLKPMLWFLFVSKAYLKIAKLKRYNEMWSRHMLDGFAIYFTFSLHSHVDYSITTTYLISRY